MRGKTTNLFTAVLNILLGVIIAIFSIKIPQDITELTVQENQIVSILRVILYVIIVIVTFSTTANIGNILLIISSLY